MIRQPQALKTRRARWLRLPDRRILSRPLLWLILLALFAVLVGVTTIARIAFDLTSPRVARYAGDLSARNQADYGFWPLGPFIPPINPEAIAAAELERSSAGASGDLPAPSSVPIVVIGQPTGTPVPEETPTPTASPSPTPTASPTLVPSPMPVVSSRRAPTSAPAPVRQVIPTPTPQEQASPTPITNPNEPPAAPPPPTATPPPPTATPLPSPSVPAQTPSPSPTAPPATPPVTQTPATPRPTSTPAPTSTPEPPLEVSFATTTLVVSEAQGRATVEVRLNRLASTTVTVAYATGGGTASPGIDYRPASGTLTFTPGAIARSFTIEILSDDLNEPNETLEIRLSNPTNAEIVGSSVAILTITDSDAPPTARFAGERRSVPENSGSAAMTVELDRPAAIDVVVPYAVSGTAGPADHSLRAGALIIPAGATGARLRFTIVDDQIDEDDEYLVVTLGTPSNAGLGSPSVYLFTIVDDDTAGVTLNQTSFTLTEGASAAYTVVLESEPTAPVTIELAPDSQVAVTPDRLVFTPANWRVPQEVRLTAVDDDVDEGDNDQETHPGRVTHRVISNDRFYARLTVPPVTVAIRDNDDAGVLVSPPLLRLTEAPGATQAAAYTVRLRSQPTAPVTVAITFDQEVTLNGLTTGPVTLTFTPATWNTPQTVQVRAVDDAVDEDGDGNQSVHTSVVDHRAASADPFYNRDAPELQPRVTVEITDNDTAGLAVSEPSGWTTSEDGDSVTFTVRLTSQPLAPVPVWVVTSDATEAQVNAPPMPLLFDALTWNLPITVTVSGVDDDLYDGPIPYSVSVAPDPASAYASLVGVTEIRLTNLDNDLVPASFVQAESVVLENAGEARLAVRLLQTLTYTVTVGYETFPGTATPDEDYTPISGVLTFAPGDLIQIIALPILDNDGATEDRYETVQVLLRPGEGTMVGTPGIATVLIEDDDVLSPLEAAPFLLTTREGGASFLEIALPCSWPADRPLSVELWSPGIHSGSVGSADIVDPVMNDGPNRTLFQLYDAGTRVASDGTSITPAGSGLLADRTFNPSSNVEAWEPLAVIAAPQPCGRYLLRAQTDGDDENYWAARVGYDHDNSPLTRPLPLSPGGEPVRLGKLLGGVEVRPPAGAPVCMTTWVDVAPGARQLVFNNFDLDEEEPGADGVRLRYYAPGDTYDPLGLTGGIEGFISGDGVWVQQSIASPESGWWRMVVCSGGRNRYALEAVVDDFPLPLLYDAPY